MNTRDLIIALLGMDMDAEIDVVRPEEELLEGDGVEICNVRKVDREGFTKYTVIELKPA